MLARLLTLPLGMSVDSSQAPSSRLQAPRYDEAGKHVLIPYPLSLIPYPLSLIPYPLSLYSPLDTAGYIEYPSTSTSRSRIRRSGIREA